MKFLTVTTLVLCFAVTYFQAKTINLNIHIKELKRYCHAKDFEQDIVIPGCAGVVISNKMCIGACYTFYQPNEPLSYCSACAPMMYTQRFRFLCYGKNIIKSVDIVTSCKCSKAS